MANVLPWGRPFVCAACRASRPRNSLIRLFSTSVKRRATLRDQIDGLRDTSRQTEPTSTARARKVPTRTPPTQSAPRTNPRPVQTTPTEEVHGSSHSASISTNAALTHDANLTVRHVQEQVLNILDSESVPDEAPVLTILRNAQQLADVLVQTQLSQQRADAQSTLQSKDQEENHSFSTEVSDTNSSALPAASLSDSQRRTLALALAKCLYTLLEDPKVYISDTTLTLYVETLTTLRLPQYLPKIFHLYATKAIPKPKSDPIQYTQPYASAPKYAIPLRLADMAIESAISSRDMPLAIAMIDTTVATPQFKVAKFIRKAALPLTLASSVVPLAWTLSSQAAHWQMTWEPETFFWMCIAGSTAYLGTMGTLLFITVTTWNDHHKRVRWVPGTPMARRWFREEERYYFDRIAQAWGFQDENRHGEETGEEWEALRELLGLRWFELDRSSLLPGML